MHFLVKATQLSTKQSPLKRGRKRILHASTGNANQSIDNSGGTMKRPWEAEERATLKTESSSFDCFWGRGAPNGPVLRDHLSAGSSRHRSDGEKPIPEGESYFERLYLRIQPSRSALIQLPHKAVDRGFTERIASLF